MRIFDNPEGGGGGGVPQRPESVTEDEWEGLSNEEREGLLMTGEGERGEVIDEEEGEELTPEELALIAGDALPGADDQAAIDAALLEASGEAEAPAGEVAAEAVAEEPATVSDEDLILFRPVVKDSELPISSDVPKELSDKLEALEALFEDNEIDNKAYQTQRDALNREILISQFGSRDEARADKVWEKEQNHFLTSRPAYLAKDLRGNAMFGALQEAVKAVSNDPKFANANGMAILVEADKAVRGLFGTPAPKVDPAKPAKPASTRPDIKTLANVPTANRNDTTADPFAALDRLSGDAFEKALERLNPEQRAEYERRA